MVRPEPPVELCVFHPTMGAGISAALGHAMPDVRVRVVSDTAVDPPGSERITGLVANRFPAGLPARCPRLRWLHLTSSGVDQLEGEALPPGLRVTHSACVPATAVAEFVWMAILAFAKQAPALWAAQAARSWRPAAARLVVGSHLLLLGLGHVGAEVARRAPTFGVRVTAVTRSGRSSPLADVVVGPGAIVEAARGADYLVVAVPGTSETRGLVDACVVDALPAHAVVINVGRASVVDTGAVVRALRAGRLRGALLDVHAREPLETTSELWSVDNLLLTPHTAFRFPGEEAAIADLVVDNLGRLRRGLPLRDEVSRGALAAAGATDVAGVRTRRPLSRGHAP